MDVQDSPVSTTDADQSPRFIQNLTGRYRVDGWFAFATWASVAIALAVLAWLLINIIFSGVGSLDGQFLSSFPSRKPEAAGILPGIVGTLYVMFIVAIVSFPIGVGTAIYLEEFSTDSWFNRVVEINIGNLAGVPSIIYGLLGLTVFVRLLGGITNGPTVLSAGLTLALLILPVVIVSSREAFRSIPNSIRLAGFALGANRWQVIWSHLLPAAMPGILTGMILALSRAIGETAPVIVVGAAAFIASLPGGLEQATFVNFLPKFFQGFFDRYTVLPMQVYDWASRPQKEFHDISASAIIVLMVLLLLMNSTAVILRNKFQSNRL